MIKPQSSINEYTQSHNKCESILIIPAQKRAAIYICIFSSRNQQSIISRQLQKCIRFIQDQGWTYADLYVERKPNDPIASLARIRAGAGHFDLIVSFTEFAPNVPITGQEISGMIAVCDAEDYAKGLFSRLKVLSHSISLG
jgi:hypothetical protein